MLSHAHMSKKEPDMKEPDTKEPDMKEPDMKEPDMKEPKCSVERQVSCLRHVPLT